MTVLDVETLCKRYRELNDLLHRATQKVDIIQKSKSSMSLNCEGAAPFHFGPDTELYRDVKAKVESVFVREQMEYQREIEAIHLKLGTE